MNIQKTEAILLNKKDVRETSVIASFFTKEFGKIKGLIKQVRGAQSKFGLYVHEFSRYDLVFYDKVRTDTYMITQCDLIEPYEAIAGDIDKRLKAFYILELIDKFTALRDEEKKIYQLLQWILDRIASQGFYEKDIILFQLKLLDYTGFLPQLENCLNCSAKIDKQAYFSIRLSGLLCQDCVSADTQAGVFSKGGIASVNMIRRQEIEKLKCTMITGSVARELNSLLHMFIAYHLGEHLKTSAVFEEIKGLYVY